MSRALIALALVAAASDAAGQHGPPGSRANLWIDFAAVDRRGTAVTDLRADEIEIWVAGYRIPIAELALVTPGQRTRSMVLLLDDAATPPAMAPRIREGARYFVDAMAPGDRMAVVSLHGGSAELTGDRDRLLRAIREFGVRALPFRIEDAGELVLRRLAALSHQLPQEGSPGRSAIVAIGPGWLFDTPLTLHAARDLRDVWVEAVRASAAAHSVLFVLDPAGVGGASGRHGGSSGLARETGGYAFLNTNDMRGAAARIRQETGTYYVAGVVNPPMQRDADLRELELKVQREGVTIRARRAIPGR